MSWNGLWTLLIELVLTTRIQCPYHNRGTKSVGISLLDMYNQCLSVRLILLTMMVLAEQVCLRTSVCSCESLSTSKMVRLFMWFEVDILVIVVGKVYKPIRQQHSSSLVAGLERQIHRRRLCAAARTSLAMLRVNNECSKCGPKVRSEGSSFPLTRLFLARSMSCSFIWSC